jgi:hypothetical protein
MEAACTTRKITNSSYSQIYSIVTIEYICYSALGAAGGLTGGHRHGQYFTLYLGSEACKINSYNDDVSIFAANM